MAKRRSDSSTDSKAKRKVEVMVNEPAPARAPEQASPSPLPAAQTPTSTTAPATPTTPRAASSAPTSPPHPLDFTADDQHLFNEGTHYRLHEKLGAHILPAGGVRFSVWAPNAKYVSVVGDFNHYDRGAHPMRPVGSSGVWTIDIPQAREGHTYKFHIASHSDGYTVDKADPFGVMHETPPKTASVVRSLDYAWRDSDWMKTRGERQSQKKAWSVYEVHLGSWMRGTDDPERYLTYRELAPRLAEYVKNLGFTHVEFLPVMEHPYYPSWGYQTTGYFAPTSRYGTPQDFMFLIDTLHQAGIGVILDWVPSHFPTDEHGLGYFDGTHLFEHSDRRQGFHPDWTSWIFNYSRHEVRAFLVSSACAWLERFHIDALRVDAVASMLYLDYARKDGEWIPNEYGGKENLAAIDFMRQLNTELYRSFPDTQTIAEESTAWGGVSRPAYTGGLGFGMKWDMGWMHDTLRYFKKEAVHRKYHHHDLTFRALYMFNENFMLPLSHDEVVHGKGSLLNKMSGDVWQKFANLRLLLTNQWTHPGKKLLFMGGEFGQWDEWNFAKSLDWHLTQYEPHKGLQRLVSDLNRLYRELPALHAHDFEHLGFEWVENNDWEQSIIAFLRKGNTPDQTALVVFNCTPVPRYGYRVGVPSLGRWSEVLNTDAPDYGGSGVGNMGAVEAQKIAWNQFEQSVSLTLPPLGAVILAAPPASHTAIAPGA